MDGLCCGLRNTAGAVMIPAGQWRALAVDGDPPAVLAAAAVIRQTVLLLHASQARDDALRRAHVGRQLSASPASSASLAARTALDGDGELSSEFLFSFRRNAPNGDIENR